MNTGGCYGEPLHIFASKALPDDDEVEKALCLEKEGSSYGFSTN